MLSVKEIKEQLQTIETKDSIPKEWLEDSRKGVQKALKSWQTQQDKKRLAEQKMQELIKYETDLTAKGFKFIAGIDEVGRGPLAGPVVAACVIMPQDELISGVNDSKKLSVQKREMLYHQIMAKAVSVGVGVIGPKVIDDVNIYQATKMAMQKAIDSLSIKPDYLLIDAMTLYNNIPQQAIIKGDAKSYNIACASIVAKVVRDDLMASYAKEYPYYGFEKNAGYGTTEHLNGLKKHGVTPIHRKSFEPVKSMDK